MKYFTTHHLNSAHDLLQSLSQRTCHLIDIINIMLVEQPHLLATDPVSSYRNGLDGSQEDYYNGTNQFDRARYDQDLANYCEATIRRANPLSHAA